MRKQKCNLCNNSHKKYKNVSAHHIIEKEVIL